MEGDKINSGGGKESRPINTTQSIRDLMQTDEVNSANFSVQSLEGYVASKVYISDALEDTQYHRLALGIKMSKELNHAMLAEAGSPKLVKNIGIYRNFGFEVFWPIIDDGSRQREAAITFYKIPEHLRKSDHLNMPVIFGINFIDYGEYGNQSPEVEEVLFPLLDFKSTQTLKFNTTGSDQVQEYYISIERLIGNSDFPKIFSLRNKLDDTILVDDPVKSDNGFLRYRLPKQYFMILSADGSTIPGEIYKAALDSRKKGAKGAEQAMLLDELMEGYISNSGQTYSQMLASARSAVFSIASGVHVAQFRLDLMVKGLDSWDELLQAVQKRLLLMKRFQISHDLNDFSDNLSVSLLNAEEILLERLMILSRSHRSSVNIENSELRFTFNHKVWNTNIVPLSQLRDKKAKKGFVTRQEIEKLSVSTDLPIGHIVYQGPGINIFFNKLKELCGNAIQVVMINQKGIASIIQEDLENYGLFEPNRALFLDLAKLRPNQIAKLKSIGLHQEFSEMLEDKSIPNDKLLLSTFDWNTADDVLVFESLQFANPVKGKFNYVNQEFDVDRQSKIEQQKLHDLHKFLNANKIFERIALLDKITGLKPYFEILEFMSQATKLNKQISKLNKELYPLKNNFNKNKLKNKQGFAPQPSSNNKLIHEIESNKQDLEKSKIQLSNSIGAIRLKLIEKIKQTKDESFQDTLKEILIEFTNYVSKNNGNETSFELANLIDLRCNLLRDWTLTRSNNIAFAITASDVIEEKELLPKEFSEDAESFQKPSVVWVTIGGGRGNVIGNLQFSGLVEKWVKGEPAMTSKMDWDKTDHFENGYLPLTTTQGQIVSAKIDDEIKALLIDIRIKLGVEPEDIVTIKVIRDLEIDRILFGNIHKETSTEVALKRLASKLDSIK